MISLPEGEEDEGNGGDEENMVLEAVLCSVCVGLRVQFPVSTEELQLQKIMFSH